MIIFSCGVSGFLTPGKSYEAFVDTETDVGDLTNVKFLWNDHMINPIWPSFGATRIEVLRGQDTKTYVHTNWLAALLSVFLLAVSSPVSVLIGCPSIRICPY